MSVIILGPHGPQQVIPMQQQQPEGPLYTEEDAKEIHEMFPAIELDVIKCVLDEKRGNKDATINALLQMNQD